MNEIELKYGCNPNQIPARVYAEGGLPFTVLNGRPGYINLLDALNSWQLVRELKAMSGLPAAASFKHVSPAGAALGLPLSETLARAAHAPKGELSPVACAYVRARGADRMSSYGDFAAVSDVCDESLAEFLRGEVSDGIIAPGYTEKALEILKSKRKGSYLVLQMDESYAPPALERKDVYGITFEQQRNEVAITVDCLRHPLCRAPRSPARAHHAKIHAVKLRLLRRRRTGNRCRCGTAVARPLHTPCRKQGGHLAAAPEPAGTRPPLP